ncbi:MAG: class I SAM-dependent methyltransferase [Candidatus Eisenbacteria bacterium]|uniref:Class I SAM-dependent methyltransferase n=1 Tax=Eiseniibacteriota bacterium TaxID=2212470 RepID=A0A956LXQ3_UNCEI|nr:class I SAM-dependent methyltransferase [Candidatus Eisenbacteria bacterium]
MYTEIADWWPLLSDPADYREEAAFFLGVLERFSTQPIRTLLELGSGGGNNASHLKAEIELTLVDLSPGMLTVSRKLNPECEHLSGDMRTVRLQREFDAVFIHDAIMYMLTREDLRRAIDTAYLHCRTGGIALFVPDQVRETFQSRFHSGGHDDGMRGIRYLQWDLPADPTVTHTDTDFVYLIRDGSGEPRVITDRHRFGLFPRADWMEALSAAGFEPSVVPDVFGRELFVGVKS